MDADLDGLGVRIPARHLLIAFKLKAAFDRGVRVNTGKSPAPDDEQAKIEKDYQDVLALLDPTHGGREVDLEYIAALFVRFPFLIDIARDCYRNPAGADGYGIPRERAETWVEDLLGLVLPAE